MGHTMVEDPIRKENMDLRERLIQAQNAYATVREELNRVRTKLESERDKAEKSQDLAWRTSDIYRGDWNTAIQRGRNAERYIAKLENAVVPDGEEGLDWLDNRLRSRGECNSPP